MMMKIKTTNRKTSFSIVVKPVFGSPASLAIRPKTVESPVATTIAVAVPETQCVP
jgi:hypothetical protein